MSESTLAIRIAAPSHATRGQIIELKAMIQHPMETGYRRDSQGAPIERFIIERFECLYEGRRVFAADFFPAVAADPLVTFFTTATQSGTLQFRWTDQHGQTASKSVELEVS